MRVEWAIQIQYFATDSTNNRVICDSDPCAQSRSPYVNASRAHCVTVIPLDTFNAL